MPDAMFEMTTSLSQYAINPFRDVDTCSESSRVGTRISALVA